MITREVMVNTVSAGICVHNEEATIGELIEQIQRENAKIDEILVVASGYDRTKDIVREKSDKYGNITLIEESERRGQSAAQNTILQEAEGDLLLLIDGDGLIKPGSIETLLDAYDGTSILYGREIPSTPDTFAGSVIQAFWQLHHELSLQQPKYTTQLALLPADAIDRLPEQIVIDDEYMAWKAQQQGYSIRYIPEAAKYHNIKGDIKSFIRHHRRNWAGMFQMQELRGTTLQPTSLKARFYLAQLIRKPLKDKFPLLIVGVLESLAFLGGLYDSITGKWPYIWER